jgi:YcaO-like protein with predicted kinase domain
MTARTQKHQRRGRAAASGLTAKGFTEGTHRTVPPAETIARVQGMLRPMGITRVANVTGLDCIGIPVTMVCRPNARSLAVSQGKGVDLDSARASGIMEAIELFHAEHILLPLKLASWNDLRFSHSVVPLDALPRYSVSSFDPNQPMVWIEGRELTSGEALWLPYELVHTNFTLPLPPGSGCFVMSSNGLASGNHPCEAIVHGLCELVERDAAALFALHPAPAQDRARVDLDSVTDPHCRSLIERCTRAGMALGVWDMTSDIRIPAFKCIVLERDANPFRALGALEGMGCHPVREVALSRAITEAVQGRLVIIAGSRDDNGRSRYRDTMAAERASLARACLSRPSVRRFTAVRSHVYDSFEEDVGWIVGRLRKVGLQQVVVVDLTKPEFGIPVFRVVVPGLETYHHVEGYLPGTRALAVVEKFSKDLHS